FPRTSFRYNHSAGPIANSYVEPVLGNRSNQHSRMGRRSCVFRWHDVEGAIAQHMKSACKAPPKRGFILLTYTPKVVYVYTSPSVYIPRYTSTSRRINSSTAYRTQSDLVTPLPDCSAFLSSHAI